jgi:uncharacterized membrane protein
MQHIHEEIRVEAPVKHVWDLYCDTSRWNDWMPRGQWSEFSGPVDKVGTTYAYTSKFMGFEMKGTSEVVEVEPLRFIHEHDEPGPMEMYLRFEPDGDATNCVVEADYEMPGKMPGFVKDIMTKGWFERQTRNMLADFKANAEAKVPAKA